MTRYGPYGPPCATAGCSNRLGYKNVSGYCCDCKRHGKGRLTLIDTEPEGFWIADENGRQVDSATLSRRWMGRKPWR